VKALFAASLSRPEQSCSPRGVRIELTLLPGYYALASQRLVDQHRVGVPPSRPAEKN
jgi:hypothetical protein